MSSHEPFFPPGFKLICLIIVLAVLITLLIGCADHSHDPQSCRERVAYNIGTLYPDPALLEKALNIVCEGQQT